MEGLYRFVSSLAPYRNIILIVLFVIIVLITILVLANVFRKLSYIRQEQRDAMRADNLKNKDYAVLDRRHRASILREAIAPDGINPAPNSYIVINDGGEDVYARVLTIVAMPKRDKFANTFADLLDFPSCTSSVFVEPIPESKITAKMDKQITIISSERAHAEKTGNINDARKLRSKQADAESYAEQVEGGENRFFEVAFAFTIYAKSIMELNKACQQFRAKALAKNIQISNCFAVQAESYAANAPLNKVQNTKSVFIKTDALVRHKLDKYSLSAVYNYTQTSYSHKDGIPLGRDLQTAAPIIFDLYDPTHEGYTLVVAGNTGCGKSATIKMMCCRQLLQGYHFVAIDSQVKKGTSEGEYAGIAEMAGGVNFQISNSSREIMNIFEVTETTRSVRDTDNTIHNVRTLELSDKITMTVNILNAMVKGAKDIKYTPDDATFVDSVLTDNVKLMYRSFGIIDGDPDSLYEADAGGNAVELGGVTSGRRLKALPTMTDYFKQLLISHRDNTDHTLDKAYSMVIKSLRDYVKELYYSQKTCRFFSREEYMKLRYAEGTKGREFINDMNQHEAVIEVKGVRPYYDGQSSIAINKSVAFTNIDISLLPESEKVLARQIAMDFVNENFIKKNSETIGSADKLVCIFDEAHENFVDDYARKTLDNVVSTARKRFVGIILCTQTIDEFGKFRETEKMLSLASVKFVFKQDTQYRDVLIKRLGITEAQADYITRHIGGNASDDNDKAQHRGEMAIIDNRQVAFCKVDYLRATEAIPVETDARAIEKLFREDGAA